MCLVLTAWRAHQDYALVVASNRDEFYARPAADLAWWGDRPDILAGRDLGGGRMGGTWLGISRTGRFAALTNVREPNQNRANMRSRGKLAADFLSENRSPQECLIDTATKGKAYNGFNLLASDLDSLWWYSNRGNCVPRELGPGIYGLSNAALDTPWPKVRDGVAEFSAALRKDDGSLSDIDSYLPLLQNDEHASTGELPNTGVTVEVESLLSARFVKTPIYGTRCSSVLRVRYDGSFDMLERRFDPDGEVHDSRTGGVLHRRPVREPELTS